MRLATMRFKGFIWPHNPKTYTITYQRTMAAHKVPFGRYQLQSLGQTRRVMKGEGEFVGEDAYRQFKMLASVFYEETPGTLVHPLWDTTSAWFVGLELEEEPRADYVKYRFEFWEDYNNYRTTAEVLTTAAESGGNAGNGGSTAVHTVGKGETMWGISEKYGLTLAELIKLNPQIKNPNLILVGQKVRVT